MRRAGLITLIVIVYLLHQDTWFWTSAHPMLFGFLPPALWYHAAYTLAIVALMMLLVRTAWPAELERQAEESRPEAVE